MRAEGVRPGTSVPAFDWRFGSFFAKASFGAETRDEVLVGAATGCVAVVALDAGVVPASVAAGALGGVVTGLVMVGRGPSESGPPLAGPELERDPAVPGAGIGAFAFGVPGPLEEHGHDDPLKFAACVTGSEDAALGVNGAWETEGDPCEAGVPVAALGGGHALGGAPELAAAAVAVVAPPPPELHAGGDPAEGVPLAEVELAVPLPGVAVPPLPEVAVWLPDVAVLLLPVAAGPLPPDVAVAPLPDLPVALPALVVALVGAPLPELIVGPLPAVAVRVAPEAAGELPPEAAGAPTPLELEIAGAGAGQEGEAPVDAPAAGGKQGAVSACARVASAHATRNAKIAAPAPIRRLTAPYEEAAHPRAPSHGGVFRHTGNR